MPRVREHFDRLVDRIAALELAALATGDGFTEQPAEPASIDELLAIRRSTPTLADRRHGRERRGRPRSRPRTTLPIPLNDRVLRYVELFQGRLREFLARAWSAARSTCR